VRLNVEGDSSLSTFVTVCELSRATYGGVCYLWFQGCVCFKSSAQLPGCFMPVPRKQVHEYTRPDCYRPMRHDTDISDALSACLVIIVPSPPHKALHHCDLLFWQAWQ
jgi:hypothetical protein